MYKVGGFREFPMAKTDRDRPSWLRYSGIGFEFVAAIAGFALVGYWVDRRWDTTPWGLVIGAGLGMVGGMYNMIRESLAAFRPRDDNQPWSKDSKP